LYLSILNAGRLKVKDD